MARFRRERQRPEADLQRGRPTRRPREFILVVCEGAKTERLYLNSLRDELNIPKANVEIVGVGKEINGAVDEAIRRRNQRVEEAQMIPWTVEFDEVWCVVDTERMVDNKAAWDKGADRAKAVKVKLAWSNPCFEYWLLLHFECVGTSFDGCKKLNPKLREHMPDYKKNVDCFGQLAPRVPTAIKNSKQIHKSQYQDTEKPMDRNPGTTVHNLVERLLEIAGISITVYQKLHPPRNA